MNLIDGHGIEWVDKRTHEARMDRLRHRAESAEAAIHAHNRACQDRCGRGDQEAVRCKYRPYFEHSGRRCPDCPTHERIEYPQGSGLYPEGGSTAGSAGGCQATAPSQAHSRGKRTAPEGSL
jgi:hypothetical protein